MEYTTSTLQNEDEAQRPIDLFVVVRGIHAGLRRSITHAHFVMTARNDNLSRRPAPFVCAARPSLGTGTSLSFWTRSPFLSSYCLLTGRRPGGRLIGRGVRCRASWRRFCGGGRRYHTCRRRAFRLMKSDRAECGPRCNQPGSRKTAPRRPYPSRNIIERMFGRIKDFAKLAIRYTSPDMPLPSTSSLQSATTCLSWP